MNEYTVRFMKMELDGEDSVMVRVYAHDVTEAYGKARQKLIDTGFKTINHDMNDVKITQVA